MLWLLVGALVYMGVLYVIELKDKKSDTIEMDFQLGPDCKITEEQTAEAKKLIDDSDSIMRKFHRIKKADKQAWLAQHVPDSVHRHQFLIAYDMFKEELKSEREFNKWING